MKFLGSHLNAHTSTSVKYYDSHTKVFYPGANPTSRNFLS